MKKLAAFLCCCLWLPVLAMNPDNSRRFRFGNLVVRGGRGAMGLHQGGENKPSVKPPLVSTKTIVEGLKDSASFVYRHRVKVALGMFLGGCLFCGFRAWKRWLSPLDGSLQEAAREGSQLEKKARSLQCAAQKNLDNSQPVVDQGERNGVLAQDLVRDSQPMVQAVAQTSKLVDGLGELEEKSERLLDRSKKFGEESVQELRRLSDSLQQLPMRGQVSVLGNSALLPDEKRVNVAYSQRK